MVSAVRKGCVLLLSALLLASSVGCARLALHRDGSEAAQAEAQQASVLTLTHHRLFWGLVPLSRSVSFEELCAPGKWVKLESQIRAAQLPFHVITAGIYSPWTLKISCLIEKQAPAGPPR